MIFWVEGAVREKEKREGTVKKQPSRWEQCTWWEDRLVEKVGGVGWRPSTRVGTWEEDGGSASLLPRTVRTKKDKR